MKFLLGVNIQKYVRLEVEAENLEDAKQFAMEEYNYTTTIESWEEAIDVEVYGVEKGLNQ